MGDGPADVLRALRTGRGLGLLLVGTLVVAACVAAGFWQLGRHELRQRTNADIRAALAAPPIPLTDLTADGAGPTDAWQSVTVVGGFGEDQVMLRQRSQDGVRGVQVLTPLTTEDGDVVLVSRGFVPNAGGVSQFPVPPTPPTGVVTVTGRARLAETSGGAGWDADTGTARAVDLDDLASVLETPLEPLWVELTEQRPAAGPEPVPVAPPRLSVGPSLIYAVQWWIFAATAAVGTVLLLRRSGADVLAAAVAGAATRSDVDQAR